MLRVLLLSGLFAAFGLPSGPQVGDKLPGFKVHAFSGAEAGKGLEPIKKAGDGPTLLVFVHKITRPGLKFLRPVDEYASKEEKLVAQIVWLGEKDATLDYLKRAENSLGLKVPIGVSLDGKDGPPSYVLNDQVTITVLLAKANRVVANFALVDPNDTDSPRVIAALDRLLEKKKR